MLASSYFINEMHQIYNGYKYFYIQNITGDILMEDGKWIMQFQTYIINNFNLPVNTFNLTLETSSQKINNLPMILLSSNDVDNDNLKVYQTQYILETGSDSFFSKKQENANYSLYLNVNLDTKVIDNYDINITQQVLDDFYNEINLQSKSTSIKYSNSLHIDSMDKFYDHIYGYYIDLENGNSEKVVQVFYEVNEFNDLEDPIQKLVNLSSIQNLLIDGTEINISYFLDGSNMKKFEYSENQKQTIYGSGSIEYHGHTLYDFNENTVMDSGTNGINGFFIPYDSYGTIEVITNICINNVTVTYYFKNSFNFIKTIFNDKPYAKATLINDISDFKKVYYE